MKRRAFTLIELVVYMGLVATALMVFGGIELAAQRSISMQGALIDIENQATRSLGALRRDVEASLRLEIRAEGRELVVHRFEGTTVIYRARERIELGPKERRVREPFSLMRQFTVARASKGVRVEALFQRGSIQRTYQRAATPRREVSGG